MHVDPSVTILQTIVCKRQKEGEGELEKRETGGGGKGREIRDIGDGKCPLLKGVAHCMTDWKSIMNEQL